MARVALPLENLGFVVREAKVMSTAMDVKLFFEVVQRHGGALDMPSGPARTPRRCPCWFVGFCRLPQSEILVISLARTRLVHPATGTGAHGINGLARQLSILFGR